MSHNIHSYNHRCLLVEVSACLYISVLCEIFYYIGSCHTGGLKVCGIIMIINVVGVGSRGSWSIGIYIYVIYVLQFYISLTR